MKFKIFFSVLNLALLGVKGLKAREMDTSPNSTMLQNVTLNNFLSFIVGIETASTYHRE